MNDKTSMIFYDNLKKYINLFNLNQAVVDNLCVVTKQSISLWLNGDMMRICYYKKYNNLITFIKAI